MRTVATRSEVYKVCEAIFAEEGRNPARVTVNKVLERTGGHKGRITLFVREWKDALDLGKSAPNIPKEMLKELNEWFRQAHAAAMEEALEAKAVAEDEVKAMQAKLQAFEAEMAAERQAHKEAINELEHQLTITKLESAARLADYHRAQEDLKAQGAELAKAQNKADQLLLEVAKLKEDAKAQEVEQKMEIDNLERQHLAALEDLREQAAAQVADISTRYDNETARLLSQIGNLREKVAGLESSNEHLKKQKAEQDSRLELLASSRDALEGENRKLQERLSEAQATIANLKGTIGSLEHLKALAGEVAELRVQLAQKNEGKSVKGNDKVSGKGSPKKGYS